MKSKAPIVVLIALLAVASSLEFDEYIANGFESLPHKFGAVHLKRETPEGFESIIQWPKNGLFSEFDHIVEMHDTWIDSEKHPEKYQITSDDLLTCDESDRPNFFKFLPTNVGQLNATVGSISYSAPCFKENTLEIVFVDDSTVELVFHAHHRSGICVDSYFISTLNNFHVEAIMTEGTHTMRFEGLSAQSIQDIQEVGIFVFRHCDKVINFLPDFFKTLWLFIGGLGLNPKIPFFGSKPTEFQIHENIRFIKEATGYQWEERPKAAQDVVVELDQSLIKSGDFLAIVRFDGLDQIIQWGAGTHAGHSTMALWVDGVLNVVESQAAWYWPRKGLQINPFDQWIQWAHNADFQVTWLPLTPEASNKFNATAAYEWFQTVEGMPYGYHNFLFGWIDTPNASYPTLLNPNFVGPMFALVEKISPFDAAEVFTLALNKRLGTVNLTMYEIAQIVEQQGMTLPDLYAIPEQDGWMYPDGYSYVCSSFVAAMWKAGGLFDPYYINGVEFTPRDIYQSEFIDIAPVVPENCKALDPENPYCQIMGTYRMQFPGISTVPAYTNMNEHCQSQAPDYPRIPQGC